jgi:signal transduction histidine kinase
MITLLLAGALAALGGALIVTLVWAARDRRALHDALAAQRGRLDADEAGQRVAEKRLRSLNRRLLVAQEEERRRIARELHDHLSQQLALLAIDLQQLAMNPPASEALAASLHEQWRRTTEIASDVHAISHRLHPSKLEALGLVATIRAHCRDLSRQGLDVRVEEPGGAPFVCAPDVALCLFRVLEEALTNVAHHSGVHRADVIVGCTDGDVLLRVSDAGCGFVHGTQRDVGLGLVSMRERLQLVGGALSVASAPGQGTVVEARVPLARASRKEDAAVDKPQRARSNVGAAARAM